MNHRPLQISFLGTKIPHRSNRVSIHQYYNQKQFKKYFFSFCFLMTSHSSRFFSFFKKNILPLIVKVKCRPKHFSMIHVLNVLCRDFQTSASGEKTDKDEQEVWIPVQNSPLYFHSLKESKCQFVFEQSLYGETGKILPPGGKGIGEWTGELSHRSCAPLPVWQDYSLFIPTSTQRAPIASRVPQSTGRTSIPSSGLHPPHNNAMRCSVDVTHYCFC